MKILYVGIDVGKTLLDIYYSNKNLIIKNSLVEINNLILELKKEASLSTIFIIFEATGGYEHSLIKILVEEKIDFHVVHPNKVRAFAKSKGILAKTDKIDAQVLCSYAEIFKPKADVPLLTNEEEKLSGLLKRREQLLQEKHRENNRLDKIHSDYVEKSIRDHLKWLEQSIENIENEIKSIHMNNEKIIHKVKLFTSVPSVGVLVALHLITYLPELGYLSHKEIASLAGVAPFNRESGKYRGKRFIQFGRGKIRKFLYMSALTSIRCYTEMKDFYKKLKEKGKPSKVILTAIMRKLLMVLNSIAKRQIP